MKGRTRFPLWLICDPRAALRLALATWLLVHCVRRYWPKSRPPTRTGAASLALACAEAILRWAITRQVLRLCGLDPRTARIIQPAPASSSLSWHAAAAPSSGLPAT